MQIDEYLKDQYFAETTKVAYRHELIRFQKFIGDGNEPTLENARAYLSHLQEKGISSGSIQRSMHAVKGYCEWSDLVIFALPHQKSKTKIRIPPIEWREPPDIITIDDLRRFLAAMETPFEKVFSLILATRGLRVAELLGLEYDKIDWKEEIITVRRKGRRSRYEKIALDPEAIEALRVHCQWARINHGRVFPYTYDQVKKWFKNLAQKAKVKFPKGSFFHNLRHLFILYEKMQGVDIDTISLAAGHTSREVTVRIYGNIPPKEIRRRLAPVPTETK